MIENITDFNMSDYLDSDKAIAEYLTQILDDGDTNELIRAIGYISKAKSMTKVANDTGLSRTSLYKTFRENSKPQFETIIKILKSFDIKLQATQCA